MNQQIIWKPINHPNILPGYLISPQGYIKAEGIDDKDCIKEPSYHSTNGYDFMLLNNKETNLQLFPLDDIIAYANIPIPESLQSKRIKVSHINGDTRDISLENLQWVEDIEEWRICTYPGVKPDMYEVSSWGRVRNKKTGNDVKSVFHQGYKDVRLKTNLGWKSIRHHRIIGWMFVSNADITYVINHIDGTKNINKPKNLEWVSPSENVKHAYDTGLKRHLFKTKNPNSKIDYLKAKMIYDELVKTSGNIQKTYDKLQLIIPNLTYAIVLNIKHNNTSWLKENNQNTNLFKKREFVSKEIIMEIAKLLYNKHGDIQSVYDEIHQKYPNISRSYISKIKNKYIHADITDTIFNKSDIFV